MILNHTLRLTLFLCLFLFESASAQFKAPHLSAPVMDQAGLISRPLEQKINRALKNLWQQEGSQIQVLTLKDLKGFSLEQASIDIVDQWQLGGKETDKGVLLLIAQKERKIRIEVGQGLEGSLTDAHSKRIISEVMVPLFQAGEAESGILLGVLNIVEKTNPEFPIREILGGKSFRPRQSIKKEESLFSRIFQALCFLFLIVLFIRNPMLFLLLLSGSRRGGGFGGGGYGGGGWSGGGGGFSGGGASGGW